MKITTTHVTKLHIITPDLGDSVSAYIEDFAEGRGKITITCCDDCWTNSWSAMGSRSMSQFFIDCSVNYLAHKLARIDETIVDYDGMRDFLKKEIINQRRNHDRGCLEARDLWESVDFAEFDERLIEAELIEKIVGDDWYCGLPKKENPDFVYLCKIITVVKEALK